MKELQAFESATCVPTEITTKSMGGDHISKYLLWVHIVMRLGWWCGWVLFNQTWILDRVFHGVVQNYISQREAHHMHHDLSWCKKRSKVCLKTVQSYICFLHGDRSSVECLTRSGPQNPPSLFLRNQELGTSNPCSFSSWIIQLSPKHLNWDRH